RVGNGGGLDELGGIAGGVGRVVVVALEGGLGGGDLVAIPAGQEAVGLLDAVPAIIAVHGVEAADDRADAADADFAQLCLDAADEVDAAAGRRVAAIAGGVEADLVAGEAAALREGGDGEGGVRGAGGGGSGA